MQTRSHRSPALLSLLSLLGLVMGALLGSPLALGCGSCEAPAPEASATESAHGSVAAADPEDLVIDGYKVIKASRREGPAPSKAQPDREARLVREPTSPDPQQGPFSLQDAVEGLGTDGLLVAEINTDLGTIFCDLHAEEVPNTVANFIGLARGRRPWWDARRAEWSRASLYEGTSFFRVIPDFLIQGGDPLDDGSGRIGYSLPHEAHPRLVHDRAGLLCMASHGPNENGGQFFITDGPQADLDVADQYTIFGECQQPEIVNRIARVPQTSENRPRTRVEILRVLIRRVAGGAASARRLPPAGVEQIPNEAAGASPGLPTREAAAEERRRLLRGDPPSGGALPGLGSHDGHPH